LYPIINSNLSAVGKMIFYTLSLGHSEVSSPAFHIKPTNKNKTAKLTIITFILLKMLLHAHLSRVHILTITLKEIFWR